MTTSNDTKAEDRKRAQQIVADFPDYDISDDHKLSLIDAITAYAEEVRREQRGECEWKGSVNPNRKIEFLTSCGVG